MCSYRSQYTAQPDNRLSGRMNLSQICVKKQTKKRACPRVREHKNTITVNAPELESIRTLSQSVDV